jgi:NAD(P)-dependent dehydrogenase (short-subunit alcohol dehydrogenase family)
MVQGVEIFSLRGKTALVTGATGHLGAAMARVLSEAGAHVLINSRSSVRTNRLTQQLIDSGGSAEPAVFDVTDQLAIAEFFAARQCRPMHILINNAYMGGAGSIELSDREAYADSYNITVTAAHNLVRAALPCLRQAIQLDGDASIINLASMYAMVSPNRSSYESSGTMNPPFYGAAKAALLQWTRYAACEFGAEGIRVNAISPGPFPSESVQKKQPDFIRTLARKVPMARIGHADEICGPLLFLASSASSFVNGANIVVDGGWTCW